MAKIGGSLSTEVLEFQPNGSPASFEVTVVNLSDRFAEFRIELFAAGADPNLGHRWYRLSPEVSTKKPPGDTTKFSIAIVDTPIPGVETINVTVQVSSPDFRDIQRYSLRLKIKPTTGLILLPIDLPVQHLLVYPRQIVQIPVRVHNPHLKTVDVILKFLGLDPSWLNEGTERRLIVGSGRQEEISFSCQPPIAVRAPSGKYSFTVEADLDGRPAGSVSGTLEVLSIGTVFLTCMPQQLWLPAKASWLPQWQSEPAVYQLRLKNASNIYQNISVYLQGKDVRKCTWEAIPAQADLRPGENIQVALRVSNRRPWWGWIRKIQIEACPQLSVGNTEPTNYPLELCLRPILPLWLQFLLSVAGLVLLLWLFSLFQIKGHTGPVNSVRFSGVVNPVISGSDDRTVRSWHLDKNHPFCQFLRWQRYCLRSRGILVDRGTNGTNSMRVSVLRFRPERNDQIAIGLENGEILLWDINSKTSIRSFSEPKSDRVFDLVFTKDSSYLFSGHGKKLRQWNLVTNRPTPQGEIDLGFAIYALALSHDESTLIVAGRYNKLFLGNWIDKNQLPRFTPMQYPQGSANDYIASLATAENLLVTADIRGFIGLWDLDECKTAPATCQPLDEWQIQYSDGKPMPISSLALTKDARYLTAAGDDGILRLWLLTKNKQRQSDFYRGKIVAKYPRRINSVDLIYQEQNLLILSGADDNQIRLNVYLLNPNP